MSDTEIFPKLCKDCAHLLGNRFHPETWTEWRCAAPANRLGINPVNGEMLYRFPQCIQARETYPDTETCKQEGFWYEEYKPPSFAGILISQSPAKVTGRERPLVLRGDVDPKDLGM